MSEVSYSREQRRQLERDNQKYGFELTQIPVSQWAPAIPPKVIEVWRSREFLVQIYQERDAMLRMSVSRTSFNAEVNRWDDGISWDHLQRLKRECGRGNLDAVEVFPADRDVVNVANMRHLWIMPESLAFAWRRAPRNDRLT